MSLHVPFFDAARLHKECEAELDAAVRGVLRSGVFLLGSRITAFEEAMKRTLSAAAEPSAHVVGCNSGTDAIVLSLRAAGIGSGDEVVCPSLTAVPTVTAICASGAETVFAEVDPDTWVLDPGKLADAIGPRTKAIVPVHLYGNAADIRGIRRVLTGLGRTDIRIVEDAAQAFGSALHGRAAGTLGDFGAFSFYPTKNVGAAGDAGAVFCRDERAAERLRQLRQYGQRDRYHAEIPGGMNSRMDEIQAAILLVKLGYRERWKKRKDRLMNAYRDALRDLPIRFQKPAEGSDIDWHLCVIQLEDRDMRDSLREELAASGIETLVHYPIPAHRQKAFQAYASKRRLNLPYTERLAETILSLPMNAGLADEEQQWVIDRIRFYLG